MVFQNNGKHKVHNFKLGNMRLETSKSYKYLGTIITNNGNFKLNEVNLKKKGQRASFMINQHITYHSKPSTAIRLFEKLIEPILTYNCEVTMAYIPRTWNYEKFTSQMWEHGREISKVVYSFLRQILGVHKKTSNVAVLAETGKYPIIINIYSMIMKYRLRLHTTDNILLKSALITNRNNQIANKKNWLEITDYLLKHTNIETTTQDERDVNKTIEKFNETLKLSYTTWWNKQAIVTGTSKLDFYYQNKRNFVFENYLDNIPKQIRIYITRLRLSCHNLPIEILRYKKIERSERICDICSMKATGDETHYLLACTNHEIKSLRQKLFMDIKQTNNQFEKFSEKQIMKYCIPMRDVNIQMATAIFIKKLIKTYRKESKIPPLYKLCEKVVEKNNIQYVT